jgi:hypothetical protein
MRDRPLFFRCSTASLAPGVIRDEADVLGRPLCEDIDKRDRKFRQFDWRWQVQTGGRENDADDLPIKQRLDRAQ